MHQDILYVIWGHSVVTNLADKTELEKVHGDVWALDLNTSQVCCMACNMLQKLCLGAVQLDWTGV